MKSSLTALCIASLSFCLAGCDNTTPSNNTSTGQPEPAASTANVPLPTMTLHEATFANNVEQVKANIAHGADVDRLVPDGNLGSYAALHAAARAGYAEVARALIEAGADVNIRADAPHRFTPLHWAARANQLELVKILVEEGGAELNVSGGTDGNIMPISFAVDLGHHDVVAYLVEKGAQLR